MRDLDSAPPRGPSPGGGRELVSLPISDGDLEAAAGSVRAGRGAGPVAGPRSVLPSLATVGLASSGLMELRLPLGLRVRAVVPAASLALVLADRRISGAGPDCQPVDLRGSGAATCAASPAAAGGSQPTRGIWRHPESGETLSAGRRRGRRIASPGDPPEPPAMFPGGNQQSGCTARGPLD